MFKFFLSFSTLIITVYGAGEFSILTHPPSTIFKGHDHIKESLLPEVFSASLGFTMEQDSNWQGMYLLDPFNLAKALVTVCVDGVADINQSKGHHFPLKTDEDESEVFEVMSRRVQERHPNIDNRLIRVELSEGIKSIKNVDLLSIKDVKLDLNYKGALKAEVEEDRIFLEEMSLFNQIIDKLEKGGLKKLSSPDIFWFKVNGLHAVSDLHGENSTETKEAKEMLVNAIERLNAAVNKLYDGKVLVSVITSDASHTRRVRRETEGHTKADEDIKDRNLAKDYDQNYPVIFNIMLWFGVVMFFVLLAVCLFIANMDPGRDSIIYRMTTSRIRKEN